MKHEIWMLLACALPLLLIFVLPFLGVSNSITLFIIVVLIFVMHFFLMGRRHGGHDH